MSFTFLMLFLVTNTFETNNADDFLKVLNDIEVSDEHCEIASIKGIQKSFCHALPQSNLYFFSDANASYFELNDDISLILTEKNITLNFMISKSNCPPDVVIYNAYENLVENAYGQIFRIEKNEVGKTLSTVLFDCCEKINFVRFNYKFSAVFPFTDADLLDQPINGNFKF